MHRQRPTRADFAAALRVAPLAHASGDGRTIAACRAIILARRLDTTVSRETLSRVRAFDSEEELCAADFAIKLWDERKASHDFRFCN